MDDCTFFSLKKYISKQVYPIGYNDNQKRFLRKKSKNFILKDDNLYIIQHDTLNGDDLLRIVVREGKITDVIDICHKDPKGHHGIAKTIKKINEQYYWIGIVKDVTEYIRNCDTCQKNKKTFQHSYSNMNVVLPVNFMWRTVGIDLIGPFYMNDNRPLSSRGYLYVLTMVCHFSKWAEAVPLYSKVTEHIADALIKTIYRFGCFMEILSDEDEKFNSKLVTIFEEKYGVKNVITTPYHSQGCCEKFNQILSNIVNKVVEDNSYDWDLNIEPALFTYRTTVHGVTNISPFEAVYGRKAVLQNPEIYDTSFDVNNDCIDTSFYESTSNYCLDMDSSFNDDKNNMLLEQHLSYQNSPCKHDNVEMLELECIQLEHNYSYQNSAIDEEFEKENNHNNTSCNIRSKRSLKPKRNNSFQYY